MHLVMNYHSYLSMTLSPLPPRLERHYEQDAHKFTAE